MGVTNIVWEWKDRGGKYDAGGFEDTRVAIVSVGTRYDNLITILNSGYLPTPYSAHPDYPFATLRKLSGRPIGPYHWRFHCDYSDAPLTQKEKEKQQTSPLDRPAKISWKTRRTSEGFWKDLDGKAVVNSAGDFFTPSPEIERSNRVAKVVKNLAEPPDWMLDYDLAINSDAFVIDGRSIPAKKARLGDVEISEQQEENGIPFRVVSFEIEIRKTLGWQPELVDRGLRKKVGTSLEQIFDNSTPKRPVSTPVLLDGAGLPLANPGPTTAKYVSFKGYLELPFNSLPLT